ncbi:MAG: CPBP family intramembrane metalloprotease [Gordonia sp. (in: high G+C Gram-positive bacteria)]|uniref:CPBP family intramembrane glutamic endopeptidase n=1 Tax=Gordonia sp. (in: high G+C Gram-positive bacteria) TaxID=84139 RepID=UPI0039E66A63
MNVTERLRTAPEPDVAVETDPAARRALVIELVIVGVLTFGFSALSALLSLIDAQLSAGGIGSTTVAINPKQADVGWIDLIRQLMSASRLLAIGALAVYLLWRSGLKLGTLGLGRPQRRDVPPGLALAALIGLPGLGLLAAAKALGLNADLVASQNDGPWWQYVTLVLMAIGNAVAEEIVVVAYFLVRLKQLGVGKNSSLAASAVLRGGYHLYQGFGGGLGNLVMGVVFGRWYQATGRVWPLVIAHAVIDVVAFLGYALLHDHLGFVTGS